MLSASQFGSRLQAARKQRGLSREAVADELDLSGAEVASWESGRREASVSEITRLGKIYQCSPLFFFLADGELGKDDLPAVVHRELSELDLTLEIKIELWRLFRLCGHGGALRKMLNQPIELEHPDYGVQRANASNFVLQGEDAARQERLRLGLQDRPVGDVARLIGRYGIWTAATGLPKGLAGLLVNHPDVGRVILVNREYPYRRRRFFYLRAFAHILFDRSGRTVVTMRQKGSSDRGEIRADAFVAEFLMPREGVGKQLAAIRTGSPNPRAHMGIYPAGSTRAEEKRGPRPVSQAVTCQDAITLANHFGVSYEVTIGRLEHLGHINSKQKGGLAKEGELVGLPIRLQSGDTKLTAPAPPETGERELRSQIMYLARKAFQQEEISRGRLIAIGRELKVTDRILCEYLGEDRYFTREAKHAL